MMNQNNYLTNTNSIHGPERRQEYAKKEPDCCMFDADHAIWNAPSWQCHSRKSGEYGNTVSVAVDMTGLNISME